MMKELIGTTLGQYKIIEKIGQGGMARVYKAHQPSLDRFVAVKVLSPILAEEPGFTERFQREALMVARLHHPNILQVYDFGVQDKYNYLVMRYVENSTTLRDLIADITPLDQLIDYIAQVADALSYAHQKGVIHRDVKPSNILIDGRWALLGDFGLVKIAQSSSQLTATGAGIGTPAYMSPEQASGSHQVDHRTDIYALGIVLHKILTGTVPHDATTPLAILVKRSTEPITPPHQIKADIPKSLEHVVLRSLAKEPDARYSTATDFAEALKKAKTDPNYREATIVRTEDATIASTTPTPPPMKPKPPTLMIGGAVAVVALVAAAIFALFILFNNDQPAAQTTVEVETSARIDAAAIVSPTDTPTAVATSTPVPLGTPTALAKINLEVRRGPAEIYDLIGYLPEGAVAEIVSQDETGQWWQIKTSLSNKGLGWIKAGEDFSEAGNTANVPIALAPPTPTPIPADTATPTPATPTQTPTTVSETPSATPTATRLVPTATPTSPSLPTATKAPTLPSGQFTLLKPNSVDEPTFGLTEFEWQWGGSLVENQGFEVRIWRDGESPAGVHDAVLDNKEGRIKTMGNNTYRLVADISDTPAVRNIRGEYNWTVVLVQIEPEYRDLGIQAPPGRLRFEPPGGGGGNGGEGDSGSKPTF
jgi:serine/threonine protein kinase